MINIKSEPVEGKKARNLCSCKMFLQLNQIKEKQVDAISGFCFFWFFLPQEEFPWAVGGVLVVPEPDFEKAVFWSGVTNEVQ